MEKIKVGISQCLLGDNVRYDGQHKLDRYLRDILGAFVQWVPICPEVDCGLSIPREAMRLVGDPDNPKLMTQKTNIDLTTKMKTWINKAIKDFKKENLCGFVFKIGSPSSGMRDIKIYKENGNLLNKKGVGLFARAFMEAFPLMPVEDDGRLHDAGLRENFIERIFVYGRWQKLFTEKKSIGNLVQFHSEHKLLIMAHNQAKLKLLGRLVAESKQKDVNNLFSEYFHILMSALSTKATAKKNSNVLYHIMGYFKKMLTADEKQELKEVIENYHQELTPLIVPITLLNHYVRKYQDEYLKCQYYLHPHPLELMLRNHV